MAKLKAVLISTLINHSDKKRTVKSSPAVRVEFPREAEVISLPDYTFNIVATPEIDGVEVSIDQGPWTACREALGVWWYDWSGFAKGDHEIVARTRKGGSVMDNSDRRRFNVN
jgi:hypothetical protein